MNEQTHSLKKRLLKKLDVQKIVVIGLIVVIFLFMSSSYDGFASWYNIKTMLMNYVPEGIVALGLTLVIISGGIDLSVAGIMPFTAIIFCLLMRAGVHFVLAMIIVLLAALAIGAFNNFLRQLLDVHPFIVTMATSLTLKGFNLVITGSGSISDLPENFLEFAKFRLWDIKLPLVVFLVLAILWMVLLSKNRFFRQVYFVGGNPKAADLCGIDCKKTLYFVYMQSAMMAAIAGIMAVVTYQAANYSYGTNLDTRAITAVVVGGTSMTRGGIGNIGGTIIGLIFIALVFNAFLLSGINTYYQDVITGIFLVVAVLFGERIKGRTV